MVLFLTLAIGIWALGRWFRVPGSARWLMIALLYLAILAVQIVFPEGHPLKASIGGTRGEWLSIGVLGAAIWLYSVGLRRLRRFVRPENAAPAPKAPGGAYGAAELDRYARHIVLREIGGPGQQALRAARVLVVGAGGLGSPVLSYLGAAGVGTLGVIDDDTVANSNLQRQVIHTDARIGMPKVFSAQAAVAAQNPYAVVRPYHRRLTEEIADELFADYDLILDGCDDPETRYVVNAAALRAGLPLVSGALSQWEGQVAVFAPGRGGPCYACLFPEPNAPGVAPSCAEGGVLGPLPGVVGAMMAVEAVKLLTGAGTPLVGAMVIYDALSGESRRITVPRRPDCEVCGGGAEG